MNKPGCFCNLTFLVTKIAECLFDGINKLIIEFQEP